MSITTTQGDEMTNMKSGTLDLHLRIKVATEQALADATAKGDRKRIRLLTERLADITAVKPVLVK